MYRTDLTAGQRRTAIRDYLKQKFLTRDSNGNYPTMANESVYLNNFINFDGIELPAINIVFMEESISVYDMAPRNYQRKFNLMIECTVESEAGDEVWNTLDTFSDQVEYLMRQDYTFENLVGESTLMSVNLDQNIDGELVYASARLTFDVTYGSDDGTDPASLDDFNNVNVDYELSSKDTVKDQFQVKQSQGD